MNFRLSQIKEVIYKNIVSNIITHNNLNMETATVLPFPFTNVPDGWLKCNGAAISRELYHDLFDIIGTTFGEGDGETTFNIPDLRGEFIRGWDDGNGVDSGRLFGVLQIDAIEHHNHQYFRPGNSRNRYSGSSSNASNPGNNVTDSTDYSTLGKFDTETRPRNVSMLYCIKY